MAGQNQIHVAPGYPMLLGANRLNDGYNFAAEVPKDGQASVVLYRKGQKLPFAEIPFPEDSRTGKVCALFLQGIQADRHEYNFRVNGEIVQDPCAYVIHGREVFGSAPDTENEHKVRCGFLTGKSYDWEDERKPDIPYENMILYKVHVRGYTKQNKLPSRKRGTFSGLVEMIPYWKELGINAVELMPAYDFMEVSKEGDHTGMISEKRKDGRVNFWGYCSGFYFAPKSSYCATKEPEIEFRDLVKALHRAGMECIMEMYFPEGTDALTALRAVQFWKIHYHVDGFHLQGEGLPAELMIRDNLLSDTKLMLAGFSEAWLKGRGHSRNVARYRSEFQQDMRRFLKSDEGMLEAAERHIRENSSDYGVINYMASQDGFTLVDTVSYNYKHNEENGEDNYDGSSYNYSWNCGVEGPSRKLSVRQLRERQIRNAFLMLLLSQGVPMIYGGDEICNSQNGNNNAYCQDNAVGWVDWKDLKKNEKILSFVRETISFRKEHPVLHSPTEMKGVDYRTNGFPDISFHGERAWYLSYENTCRLLGVMYCGAYAQKPDGTPDDDIYVAYNFHWENRTIALPNLPGEKKWKVIADTSGEGETGWFFEREETYQKSIEIAPRTIVVLIGR